MTKSNTPSENQEVVQTGPTIVDREIERDALAADLFAANIEIAELKAKLKERVTVEQATAIREKVGTNSAKLPWPQDRGGITSLLRREGARAIGRIGGREDRLELVLEVLDILREYAIEKYEFQRTAADNKRKAAEERAEFIRTQRKREAATAIQAKVDLAKQSNKEAKALKKEFDALYNKEV
jgi:hypothetical protein